jgi:leader peptidase (prepilin peptidase) / N-methyltransferase
MHAFAVAVAAVYGLIIGSFINAWAYRLPRRISIAKGRSFCPACESPIRARDNVPLVSWLLLRGRCRSCGERISVRYPLGELAVGVLFAVVAVVDGPSWLLAPHLLFVATLVLVSEVDIDARIIPDVIILPSAVLGLALMVAIKPGRWVEWLAAGLGAALGMFLVGEIYMRLRGVTGMGMGDVKMALCMGFYLGVAVVPALFIAFVVGAIGGVILMAVTGRGGKTAVPFGPFLALGAVVGLFAGEPLIHAYLHLALRR